MQGKRIHLTATGEPAPKLGRLAKIRDAAVEYGLDYRYMRRLVDERRVASTKLGKYRLVDLDDLDRLLAYNYTAAVGRFSPQDGEEEPTC